MARWNILGAGLVTIFLTAIATANWPASPDSNLLICGRNGTQTSTQICATSDGGCYVSWKEIAANGFVLYLQRVSASGLPLWGDCGIVVDTAAVSEYDLTVDLNDDAVIVVTDSRAGSDDDVYVYRISPAGAFVWSANGLVVSNNANDESEPQIILTTNGNILFAWQEETTAGSVVNLRKITAGGIDVWTPAVRTLTGAFGLSLPRLAIAENDAAILQYLKHTGSQITSPLHICAQKYDAAGLAMWADTGVVVSNADGIEAVFIPELAPDSQGGAYCSWIDVRNIFSRAFAQHIRANGTMAWTANGVQLSGTASELQIFPSFAQIPGTTNIAVFYVVTNMSHTQFGVGGQLLDSAGSSLWGAGGQNFVGMEARQCLNVRAFPQQGNFSVLYFENSAHTSTINWLRAFSVNVSGQFVWPNIVFMSIPDALKNHMEATVNPLGQIIASWCDYRLDASADIYLQNINPDGSLGDLSGPRPGISILFPTDSSITEFLPFYMMVLLENFNPAPPPGGDGEIEVRVNGVVEGWLTDPITAQANMLNPGMNTVVLELVTHSHQPLPHRAMDSIHVVYMPNGTESPPESIVREFALSAPHPNPFNPSTTLQFSLPNDGYVSLALFDILGREVLPLVSGWQQAGVHEIMVDASRLPGGLYFCRFSAGRYSAVQKLVLLK